MTDLYIATPTQADYDALMRLAEAAGYTWRTGSRPTKTNLWGVREEETVIRLYVGHHGRKKILCARQDYYESRGATIETIPNLAKIKEIWKISSENRDVFTAKHRLPPHYKSARNLYVICDEYSGTYTTKENEIYKALAVEYKPEESEEVMGHKVVPLPKFMCNYLNKRDLDRSPLPVIGAIESDALKEPAEVTDWLGSEDNQWKLIDALHYGYEPEPEPRWGVKAGNYYLSTHSQQINNFSLSLLDAKSYKFKGDAEGTTRQLGFGEVVDLNKEGETHA